MLKFPFIVEDIEGQSRKHGAGPWQRGACGGEKGPERKAGGTLRPNLPSGREGI